MSVNLIESIEELANNGRCLTTNMSLCWEGYHINTTNPATCVTAKIDNDQRCCEVFGIHTSPNLLSFVGAEYQSIEVQESWNEDISQETTYDLSVTIHTNRGDLVVSFYNEHNGYYAHDVSVESELGCKLYRI